MKRFAFVFVIIYISVLTASAQTPRFIFDNDSLMQQIGSEQQVRPRPAIPTDSLARANMADSLSKIPPAIPAWYIDERFGERIPIAMDTMFTNFHNESLVEGHDVAMTYLGNIGSPAQSRIFLNREETSQFNFLDPFSYTYKRPGNQRFIDTKRPYSNIFYQSGGSSLSKEERFSGEMAISLNKKLSFGFNIDYLYARGYYAYLANKQNNYNLWASYRTDNYQMHAFIANNNYTNSENGGLADDGYLSGNVGGTQVNTNKTQEFLTKLDKTWNKMRGRRIYLTNKYSVGYRKDDDETFVPVASIILTNNYTDQRRSFYSSSDSINKLYGYSTDGKTELGNAPVSDKMSYWSFKNTLAIALNEGFRPWVKFGLKAFIEQDTRKYQIPGPQYPAYSSKRFSQNSTVIGGVLSKDKGRFLHYNMSASFGVLGYNIGESRLSADISSRIKIREQEAIVKAEAYIKNLKPTFFEDRYNSKYYNFNNDFSDIRRVYIGGEIIIPHAQTRIKGGVENVQNYIYYSYATPMNRVDTTAILQSNKNIQVLSLRLDQNLSYRALHWDNQVVFQTSSEEDVIPLPKISIYSNLYLNLKLAKVLNIQLGVDARYFTEYYGPAYDPVLLQFYNQKETKIGNFPLINAYANFHLKRTRIFVMMYNIGKDFNNSKYFSAAHYPVNPMIFRMGLSWNFTD